jgi:hypothetical protein
MSIFREFGGRDSYFTSNELDRLQNPEKYNYDQAGYDAYSASVQKKHDSRQAADSVSQDAIPYGYAGRGTGATNPAFSFAGYSGHTSGGTAGNVNLGGQAGIFGSGSTTETTGSGTGTGGGPGGGGPGGGGPGGGGNMQHRAEGGVIYPVQHMEAGGMIATPYANPMKEQMGSPSARPMMQEQMGYTPDRGGMGGVGGMFQNMQQQFGQQMTQMQSSPLKVYSDYLNQTYTGPQSQEMQSKVTEFVDLVDQAERAHFGAEESFGYGKPPSQPQLGNNMPQMQTMGPGSMSGGSGIASLPNAF